MAVLLDDQHATELFVGRNSELALVGDILVRQDSRICVVYVHGPRGIGKSALLLQFERLGQSLGKAVYRFNLSSNAAAAIADDLQDLQSNLRGAGTGIQNLVLFDTSEPLSNLSERYSNLERFASTSTLVVLAGLTEPFPERTGLSRTIELGPLTHGESLEYMRSVSIPPEEQERIYHLTRGYPLSMTLVANAFLARPDFRLDAAFEHELAHTLLKRLLPDVPSNLHRYALEASSVVLVLDEDLLGAIIDESDTTSIFAWLYDLPFMKTESAGLAPCIFARNIIMTELNARNHKRVDELRNRAWNYYRLQASRLGPDHDFHNLQAIAHLARTQADRTDAPHGYQLTDIIIERPREQELSSVRAMSDRFEARPIARFIDRWLRRHPESVVLARNKRGEPLGFAMLLWFNDLSKLDLRNAPGIRSAATYVDATAPSRPIEDSAYIYLCLGPETPDSAPALRTALVNYSVAVCLRNSHLAYSFFAAKTPLDPPPAGFAHSKDLDFNCGGMHYTVYGHDWRALPLDSVLQRMTPESTRGNVVAPAAIAQPEYLILGQREFLSEARQAFQNIRNPHFLRDSKLFRTDLLSPYEISKDRLAAFQALLENLVDELRLNPKERHLHDAYWRTYVEPERGQRASARVLDLPFSTYREHLAKALDVLAERLWHVWIAGKRSRTARESTS